ncbi:MAG: AAA family ATPase [Candidatus Ratteibacteria bacterium]|nr:AAA family ATPase [Candidatus Ratteibacteria bacterium]
MYFKKLELFGFKSFPDKVKLVFEPGITAIVGPNGSGKTNIADAIRWILGEQSPRMLRGNRMEDIIFAGTQDRKPLGIAEAFLTLDNSHGIFPIEFSELTVGRRLFRSGESEYYINKNACRLKDIEELFMDTGLGRKAYSIIDQEKMELILSSSAEERRALFEEAAGVMKYKVKKEEALRKLERTEQNLFRLGDVISEVDRQLSSISRQFQKAQRYKRYKGELGNLEIKLGRKQWLELQAILKKKKSDKNQAGDKKTELAEKINQAEAGIEVLRKALSEIDLQLSKHQTQNIVKKKELESFEERIQLSRHYLNEIKEEEGNKTVQLEFLSQRGKEREKELVLTREKLKCLSAEEQKGKEELVKLEEKAVQISKEVERFKKDLEEIKVETFELVRGSSQIKNKLGALGSQLNKDLEKSLFNFYNRKTQIVSSLKLKEEEINRLKRSLNPADCFHKIEGKVGEMFKTEPKYALAIEAALASYASGLVVENFSLARNNLILIKNKKLEREKFIVLEKVPGKIDMEIPDLIAADEKVLGRASDLIDCQVQYRPLFDYLLKQVLVVKDFDSAQKLLKTLSFPWRVVTLNGELIEVPAVVSAGSPERISKLAFRKDELKNLEEAFNNLKRDLQVLENEEKEQKIAISGKTEKERRELLKELEAKETVNRRLESQLKSKEAAYEEKNRDLEAQRELIVDLRIELKSLGEKKTSYSFMVSHLEGSSQESSSSISTWEKDLERRQERKEALKETVENSGKKIELTLLETAKLDKEIVKLQREKAELINTLEISRESYDGVKKEKEFFQETAHNLDVEIATIEAEINNLTGRLKEDYNLSPEREAESEPIENIDEVENRVEFLKERLKSMGLVNLAALEEHKELEERSRFLKSQSEDLKKSKESLREVIQEVNKTTRILFMETFSLIQRHFGEIFRSLFGGGNARLILQDSDNILESGIEIVVSPPGKKLQNMNLLSGGEKTLTVISLLLSLFKIKPSPFCVLDEIDAALDESNVHRFAAFLKRFSEKSQFIIITHNKETIVASDLIYGVTMEEAGISKIVSVKLTHDKPEPILVPEAVPSA